MPRLNYNTDFTELIDPLFAAIRVMVREKFTFSSIMNGYVEGSNSAYFNGFTPSIKAYPEMFNISVENDWTFNSWRGLQLANKDEWHSDRVGGGRVVFNPISKIKISMQLDRLDVGTLSSFQRETLEYLEVKTVEFTYEFTQKDENKRKFTKADIKRIVKELEKQLEIFMEDMHKATEIQATRRFAELQEVDEEIAMKYLPETVKDIFIF